MKRPERRDPSAIHWIRPTALIVGALWSLVSGAETRVVPSVSASATVSSDDGAEGDANDEFILQVTPSIRVSRTGGRLNGGFNASLNNVWYASDSDRNTSFISFRGTGEYEAVENQLFLQAAGSVSRRDRSLFSSRNDSDPLNSDATNESRVFTVSPKLLFNLWGDAQGSVIYRSTWNSSGGGQSESRSETWNASVNDASAFGSLGWFANYTRNTSYYDEEVGSVSDAVGRFGLSYRVTPRLSVRATVGREFNDFDVGSNNSGTTYGLGFDWAPTPRTALSAFAEERVFGRGYDVSFHHRARRSAWTLSYSRDYSSSQSLVRTSLEDYYYDLIYASLGSIDDEVLRDSLTRSLMQSLGLEGVSGEVGFVSNSRALRENLSASVVISGLRDTITASVFQSENERLVSDVIVSIDDDFALSTSVKSYGGILSWAHRFTPNTSGNASLSRRHSEGSGSQGRSQRLTDLSLGVTRQLGARTTGAVTYVNTWRSGDSSGESRRLTATVNMTFD